MHMLHEFRIISMEFYFPCICIKIEEFILENVDKLGILPPIFSIIGLPCKFKNGSKMCIFHIRGRSSRGSKLTRIFYNLFSIYEN